MLIKDVRALELRVWTDGLSIEVDTDAVANAPARPVDLVEPGNRLFLLKGDGWQGYVVGGAVFFAEDDKEIGEPSAFSKSFEIGIGIR